MTYNRAVYLLACLLAVSIFPLLWVGGMVTSKGAGMSVPDWPNTFGYNMFLVPWERWAPGTAGGVFWEHFHRLLGAWVGFVSLTLCGVAWFTDRRRWVKVVSTLLLVGICLQGIKGGLRVLDSSLTLAIAHGIFGQIVFTGSCLFALLTSKLWANQLREFTFLGSSNAKLARRVSVGLIAVTVLCVTQLSVGALMRHNPMRGVNGGAGLAIPDWPLHYGKIIPPISRADVDAVNQIRPFDYNLPPITPGDVHLHITHRLGAYTLALVAVIVAGAMILRLGKTCLFSRVGGCVLLTLLALQITWGVLTVVYRKPADIATLHQATGALLLMTSVVLTFVMWRWTRRTQATAHIEDRVRSSKRESFAVASGLAGGNPRRQVEARQAESREATSVEAGVR